MVWVRVRVGVGVRVKISVNPHLRNEPNTAGDTGSISGLSSCISNPPNPSLLSMARVRVRVRVRSRGLLPTHTIHTMHHG